LEIRNETSPPPRKLLQCVFNTFVGGGTHNKITTCGLPGTVVLNIEDMGTVSLRQWNVPGD